MKKRLLAMLLALVSIAATAQQTNEYQTFISEGFKVKCGCKLFVNTLHIQMAKEQGINNVINSYACAENEDNPEIAVITNITIADVSELYKNVPASGYALAEKSYFEKYASDIKNYGVSSFSYTTFRGLSALEYNFDQMGMPTRAIHFVKNKKAYLLQVATRKYLTTKYNALKSSFDFL